jgi:methionyl-tRNA formyltransferase
MSKNIIFLGTPKIASDILNTLLQCSVNVVGVICQPDRPGNRGKVIFSEVKETALNNNLKLFQPNKISEITDEITKLSPDLIITCAYGLIVPSSILSIPKYGCINVHTSLLPKFRGAAPINYAIMENEQETGVTLMYMDKGMDTGDIIKQKKVKIEKDETYTSLYSKLSLIGCELIKDNLDKLFSDNVTRAVQNHSEASFSSKITRETEKIDFNESAVKIDCLVRALYNKPLAFITYNDIDVKILTTEVVQENHSKNIGEIVSIDKNGILVQTKKDCILIKQIQIPGKKPTYVKDYINGNNMFKVGSEI